MPEPSREPQPPQPLPEPAAAPQKLTKEEYLERRRRDREQAEPLEPTRSLVKPLPGAYTVEYPLSLAGRVVEAVRATTLSFLLGCLLAAGTIFMLGLAAEENLFDYDTNQGIDAWSRAGIGAVSLIAVAGGIIVTLARGIVDRATSAALARAARAGAPTLARPVTAQRRRVAGRSFGAFLIMSGWLLLFALLALLITVLVYFEDPDDPVGGIAVAVVVGFLALVVGAMLATKPLRKAHARDRIIASDHWNTVLWSTEQRSTAERREVQVERSEKRRAGVPRAGAITTRIGTVALIATGTLLMLVTIFRKPGGRFSTGTQYYSDAVEGFLSAVMVGAVATAALGALALLVGVLLTRVGRQRDMAELESAMDDERAKRPKHRLLQRAARPASAEWALLLTALGGAGFLLSGLSLAFALQRVVPFVGAETSLTVALGASALAFLAGLGFEVHALEAGRRLRNRIEQRWPGALD